MKDRDIPSMLKGAFDKINDLVPSGVTDLNNVHVQIYERCQVSRDLDMVVAHEVYVICKGSKILESSNNYTTLIKTINSIRELVQEHLEYYSA